LSTSFQGNARGSGGPGKEATECICLTRVLNHPGNFSVDNWLAALEPNGWLTRFNMPSLPRENDMVASEATSVTNYVIFIANVNRYKCTESRSRYVISELFNWIRKLRIFLSKKDFPQRCLDNFNMVVQ